MKRSWKKVIECASEWLGTEEKGEWLKDMRGNLAMVATVIATMTFQVGLNPPGGFVQNGNNGYVGCNLDINDADHACPGESVNATADKRGYFLFTVFNNISFFSSLIVCLWLISGLPLNHRFPTWLLSIGMCISLTSLALTYLYGARFVTPDYEPLKHNEALTPDESSIKVWFAVVGVAGFFLVMRFVLLFVAIFTKGSNKPTTTPTDETRVINRST